MWVRKEKKNIILNPKNVTVPRNLWQESEIRACLKADLLAPRKNPFAFSSDHLDWKEQLLSCCWWERLRVCLAARLAHSPTRGILCWTYLFDSGQTFKLTTHWNDSPVSCRLYKHSLLKTPNGVTWYGWV